MIYLINYGNEPYSKMQKFQSYTAKRFGVFDKIIEFSDKDVAKDSGFFNANKKILSIKKGNGLFLWKPYIIFKTLQTLNQDDFLIYCDVDTIFLDSILPLIGLMDKENKDIIVFDSPNKEYQYTKYNLCLELGLTDKAITETRQRYASYSVWRKTDFSLFFAKEWLDTCCQYDLICDDVTAYHPIFGKEFIHNLQDQSIFSLLSKKYQIESFRDPSNWGNGLIKEYNNSNYSQILYNGVGNSRKLWWLTYFFGKRYLKKFQLHSRK
jgi:hypothetical protein